MKSLIAILSLATASTVAAQTQSNAPLPTDLKIVSYALGVNVGLSLSNTVRFLDATNLDFDVMAAAMKEVLARQTPRLTKNEAAAIVTNWSAIRRREVAAENLPAGRAYIANFAKEPGVKELTNGIFYRVVKEGDGPMPTTNDTVTVNYRGRLIDGWEFDSSFSRNEPWDTQVRRVIRGWTEVLQRMKVGAKWDFVVPAELAYGERGNTGGAIPPNSVLVYELELLAIKSNNPPAAVAAPPMRNPGAGTNSLPTVR